MKTYVLMLSKTFPATHPKAGQRTNFYNNILEVNKVHTIRKNYQFWKKRIDEVNKGNACISVREWIGKPRKSFQNELFELHKGEVEIQKIAKKIEGGILLEVNGETKPVAFAELAANDGLSMQDFEDWFSDGSFNEPCAIIHFTPFRY